MAPLSLSRSHTLSLSCVFSFSRSLVLSLRESLRRMCPADLHSPRCFQWFLSQSHTPVAEPVNSGGGEFLRDYGQDVSSELSCQPPCIPASSPTRAHVATGDGSPLRPSAGFHRSARGEPEKSSDGQLNVIYIPAGLRRRLSFIYRWM